MSIHRIVPAAATAAFALITVFSANAKPAPKPPKVKPAAAHANAVKPAAAHRTTAKPAAAHGPRSTTTVKPSTQSHHGGSQANAVKPATARPKGQAKTQSTGGKKTNNGAVTNNGGVTAGRPNNATGSNNGPAVNDGSPTGGRPAPSDPVKLSKAQQQLKKNDHLRAKVESRLPPDIKPVTAAAGFKNLGQFLSAVNASHNLGIDFFALKSLMVGPEHLSLGQAIQQVKGVSAATANAAANNAIAGANNDLNASAGTTTTKSKATRNNRG